MSELLSRVNDPIVCTDALHRELAAALERVRDVHQPIDAVHYQGRKQTMRQVCTGCGTDAGNWQVWPCPTIRAIERKS